MKKVIVKVFFISMIIMIFGGLFPKEQYAAINSDEFAEFENVYVSEAPNVEVAEVSSTFTSANEIEVYLKANHEEIKKVIFSGWSGGVYKEYATSKEAKYDSMRDIYTITFQLNEIVDTQTNEIKNENGIIYSFDAIVYGKNNTMSYVKLDDVQYAENGFITNTETNENNETVINVTAEQDGYIAIVNANEEITEETNWQPATAGANTYVLPKSEESDSTNQVKILYKAGEEVTQEQITLLSDEVEDGVSNYQNDETFNFEINQVDGKPSWISYDDTPNIFETTIQGCPDTTATAIITIYTRYAGTLSFEYLLSSEKEFDIFFVKHENDEKENYQLYDTDGKNKWKSFSKTYEAPQNGYFKIYLNYVKDKNINRNEDKVAIRNLKFISVLPTNGEVKINSGDKYTSNKELNLDISVDGGSHMYISEESTKPSVTAEGWQAFQKKVAYTLKNDTDGEKNIYVWFKNQNDAITIRPVRASIKLDTIAPTTTVPIVESTSNSIRVKLSQTDANEFVTIKYGYRLYGSTSEYTWIENANEDTYTITGLTPMQQYEVVTKVFDGANPEVTSEPTIIKTKIPSDEIAITRTPSEDTLDNVTVTIKWNNDIYTKEYSLDNINWEIATDTTTIEMTQNGTIYYKMSNETYDTGILEYVVDNIDRKGPSVKEIGVISPESGKYGIDDEITIEAKFDEELIITSLPTLNIKFGDNNLITLTAESNTETSITYKYIITGADSGYLTIDSLSGGLIVDFLNNEMNYDLPKITGSVIFAENVAYLENTNKVYATIQNAINAAGTTPSVIRVMSNNILRDTLVIKEGQNITLDINGKEITFENDKNIVTAIENSGNLKIIDSSENKNGKIIATSKNLSAYTIINNSKGNLIIEDGKIEANSSTQSISLESYAIYNKGAGSITLGKEDNQVKQNTPEIIAIAPNSIGLYIVDLNGTINFYDGIIKGTKVATYVAAGADAYKMPSGYFENQETASENGIEYKVAYLSNENNIQLTMNGKTTGYKTIFEAIDQIPTDGRLGIVKLSKDEELTDIVKIYKGQNVEIDLNGHILSRKESIYGGLYTILNNGTLKITDTSESKAGEIRAISTKDVATYGIYNYKNGLLTIEAGKIYARIDSSYSNIKNMAYAMYSESSEKVNITGGEFYSPNIYIDTALVVTQSGKYVNQKLETVEGITYKVNYLTENPMVTLTLNGATIGYSGVQQAIDFNTLAESFGTITMLQNEEFVKTLEIAQGKKVEIELNGLMITTKENADGINNNGDLIIKDNSEGNTGTITGKSKSYSNYLVKNLTNNSNLEIHDGNLIANGFSGISKTGSGNIKILGGLIKSDGTSSSTNGVYVNNNVTLEVSGGSIIAIGYAVNITGSTATFNYTGGELKGKINGVCIPAGMIISNSGSTIEKKVNIPLNMYIGYNLEDDYVVNTLKEGQCVAELTVGTQTDKYVSIQDAIYNLPTNGTLGKIKLLLNESLGRNINIASGRNVEIDLNGYDLYYNGENMISNKGTTTITDSSTEQVGKLIGKINILYNTSSGTFIINSGNIISSNTRVVYNSTATSSVYINGGKIIAEKDSLGSDNYVIHNYQAGYIEINGGEIYVKGSGSGSLIYNEKEGSIVINNGILKSEVTSSLYYAITNNSTGTIEINGGNIFCIPERDGISNKKDGNLIIRKGIMPGISNKGKGNITIGNDDGIINNDELIINGQISLSSKGASVNFYDGIIRSQNKTVSSNEIIFKNIDAPSETEFVINIPLGTEMQDEQIGDLKVKYLKYIDGHENQILDKESPYISNIEIIEPVPGEYTKGNVVILRANWNEEINTIEDEVPELKIKFGNGNIRTTNLKEIGNDYIMYEYLITEEDNGTLKIEEYLGGTVTDNSGNNWQQTIIKLIGGPIQAGTRVYVASKDKYYYNIQQAINDCELNAVDYTTIKLIADDEYCGYGLTINQTQKIEIDMNSKNLKMDYINKSIINNGELRITDSSLEKNGKIQIFGHLNTFGNGTYNYVIYNTIGTALEINSIEINAVFHNASSSIVNDYGIFCESNVNLVIKDSIINLNSDMNMTNTVYVSSGGRIELNNTIVNALTAANSIKTYGVYIKEKSSTVILKDIELKGKSAGIYIPYDCLINNETETVISQNINIPLNTHIGFREEDKYIINYIEEDPHTVELTVGDTTVGYASIYDAIYNAPKDNSTLGKIKMLKDSLLAKSIKIESNQNIEFDLNGKTLEAKESTAIINYGNLTIKDNSNEKTGIIINNLSSEYTIENNTKTLIIESGTIYSKENNNPTYGIRNVFSGTIIMKGGKIDLNSNSSYGIRNSSSGKIEIRGGEIKSSFGVDASNGTIYFEDGLLKGTRIGIYLPAGKLINNDGTIKTGYVNIPLNKHIGYKADDGYIINYLEDGQYVAELTIGTETDKFTSVQEAIYNVPENGTAVIKMLLNEALSIPISIKQGQNVTIDINGKTIQTQAGSAIENNGNVIIIDTSEDKSGVIEASNYCISVIGGGTTEINGGTLRGASTGVAIKNSSTGKVIVNDGEIFTGHSNVIENTSTGTIEVNGGRIRFAPTGTSYYGNVAGIYNSTTGTVTINGGIIESYIYAVRFNNKDSLFYFNSGKLIGKSQSIYPSDKIIDLQDNTYVKTYKENIDGIVYNISEIAETGNVKLINNGVPSYHATLSDAINSAPSNGLSQIQLLNDEKMTSNIVIDNKNIQLDLNGKTITYYSNAQKIIAFENKGNFEIIDTVGNGILKVEADGFEACAVKNSTTTSTFKLYDANIEVIVNDNTSKAYGIYNDKSTMIEVGNEAIHIDGGSISVKCGSYENSITTGISYAIYNNEGGSIAVLGEEANIISTSEHNESYGIYSQSTSSNIVITIGEKDGVISNISPYIKAGTTGIRTNNTKFDFYDGRITGALTKSINGNIGAVEDDSTTYVINHQDGTESTILLKELKFIEIEPKEFVFKDLNESGEIFVTYLPIDATDVKVNYEIKDDTVATIEITDDKYIVRPKGDGETEIVFTVTDLIGNTFTETCKVSIDMTAPTDTAPTAVSTGTKITVTCNQTDDHLDESTIKYAISSDGGVTWSNWTNRDTFSGLTPDTEYMVKTKASDIVGNETESQPTTIKTKLNNNSELVLEPDTITKDSVDVIITWNNPQNIPQYYKVDDGEWTLVTGETTEVTVTETNVTVYTKLIYDGNEDSDINYIVVDNIDKLAPTGLMNITEETSDYGGNVTLNITALDDATTTGDNAGAVAYIYITEENLSEAPAEDDEKWIRYTGDGEYRYTLPNVEGDYTVNVWFKDKAGNVSTSPASDTVKYIQPIIVLIEDENIVGGYDTIQEAYNVARVNNEKPSTIKVLKGHTMTASLTIDSIKNIVLDLNGQIVSSSFKTAIFNNGKLEIKDSMGEGKFTNTYGNTDVFTIENTANLTISSGTIETIYAGTGSYRVATIHNTGSLGRLLVSGGKVYAQNSNTGYYIAYAACGIFNESTYDVEDSLEVTGGTIEAVGLDGAYAAGIYVYSTGKVNVSNANIIGKAEKAYAYGIYINVYDSTVTIQSGNIYGTTSSSSSAYGIGMSLSSKVILGTNDGVVDNDILSIEGKNYGIYRGGGTYYFYDGSIIGSKNNSIWSTMSSIVVPTNYGILKTIENDREIATLQYDNVSPTIESLEITNNVDVNSQTLIAKGVEDIGTGVVGYYTSQNQTVPTKTSVYWTEITQTNGPIDITKDMTTMGTWYFWVMDSAGNVSETRSVVVENIKIKAYYAYIDAATGNVGEKVQIITRLSPENAEPKSTLFTSSDTKVAYIDSETGIATCLSVGTTNITYTVINYDGTAQTATAVLTVIDDKLNIIEHPIDRTVKEGTTTTFGVTAEGNNLNYQWYEVVDGEATKLDEKSLRILKSNIEGQSNATTNETIIIKTTSPGTVSFDYMVSSEENNDIFKITIEDINGEVIAVDNISGNVDWTNYSKAVTPTTAGEVKITLTYTKNDSIDAGLDFGAIKNLEYNSDIVIGKYVSDFTNDEIITIKSKDTSVNTASNHDWIIDNTNGLIYKSNSKDQHGSYATASIEIKMEEPGEISFDYKVSSESGWDKLFIKIIEANNKETYVGSSSGLSGAGSWQTHKATVTPNDKGIVRITLLYQKDGSVSREDDMGAIRNLTVPTKEVKCNFETDNIFELSNNFEKVSYQGVNTALLMIPGGLVLKELSGNGYYCEVSNTRTITSDVATLTVADEEVPVDNSVTRTAPTLIAEYKKITATCNQVGEGITNTYYAISSDGITYGEWQESNVFENITEGEIYYVKTKVKNANGEVESSSSNIFAPVYIASLTENSVTTYYNSVQDAVDAANANNPTEKSKIVLLNDEIRSTEVKVIAGKNISFDLNGNELKFVYNSSSNYNGINNYGKLEIIDTGSTGKIDILSSRTSSYNAYGIYNQSGATLDLKQGEIVVTRPTSYSTYARGIYNYYGTVTIGEDDGNVSVENPKITSSGYGIYNYGTGKISFYDGIITAGKSLSTYGTISSYPKNYKLKKEEQDGKEIAYLEGLKVDTDKALITEWTIPANNTTITLPISTNTNVNLVVDWGDNSELELVNARTFPTHKYASAGVYNIKISGTCYDFGNYNQSTSSNYTTFTNYLTGIIQWGELGATRYGFANCTKLAGSIPAPMEKTFENVTNMSNMFYNCSSLTSLDLSKWNTEKVTNMASMFYNCSNLTLIILGEKFDKLSGTSMFSGCNKLTAVITQKSITNSGDAIELIANTGLETQSNIILYVPNEVSEKAYESNTTYANILGFTIKEDSSKIEPILGLFGDKELTVKINQEYEEFATVAGFKSTTETDITPEEVKEFGYELTQTSNNVDLTTEGEYEVIYKLTCKGEDVDTITRKVLVIDPYKAPTAPTIIVKQGTEEKESGEWLTDNVTIEITGSTLEGEGAIKYSYSFDNVNWVDYSTIIEYSTETKETILYAKAYNEADEAKATVTTYLIKLDKQAPTIEKVDVTGEGLERTIEFKASDSTSGINGYALTMSKEEPETWIEVNPSLNELEEEFVVNQNNVYYLWVRDEMGHIVMSEKINISDIFKGNELVTVWNITSANTEIKLPILANLSNNYSVYWGDGISNNYTVEAFPTHTFAEAGEYTIIIEGNVDTFGYYKLDVPLENNLYSDYYTFTKYLKGIKNWGNIGLRRIGFAHCSNLSGTIPEATGFANLTSVENMFLNCAGLTEPIQANFLSEAKEITSAKAMFKNCINLKGSIPMDFFKNNTKIKTFESTFENCQNITGQIPESLFATATAVTNYARTFKDCYQLSGVIPGTLFANSPEVENFRETFANCKSLTSPEANGEGVQLIVNSNLFANNKYVLNYYRTFHNCTSLTGIVNEELFASNNTIRELPENESATTGYIATFEGCTGITKVNSEKLIVGHNMFKGCTSLESVNLTNIIDIGNEAFYGCNSLTKIIVDEKYLETIGEDAFEYTGTDPKILFTHISPDSEILAEYDWNADNRAVDIEAPKGIVEIITDKYPFTKTKDVEVEISLTDNYSDATKCEIAIINEDVYQQLEEGAITYNELPWQAYIENTTWSLTEEEGAKTVWVFFKDEIGNFSKMERDL